ncbi:pyridoxal-phosphate dependent enzyme [Sphaerisporangium sp. NPDC005289]|uniref:threonine ammonia-lyase n=1 Tax=Sphaerisporangium sp. NPDC005289 TaxID=3155247 RepID=UPI0033B95B48
MTSPPWPARSVAVPTAEEMRTAWRLVAAHLAPTPVDPGAGTAREPALKLESLQPTGSFKVRGALAALAAAPPRSPVVTASAGNHALGLAFAARALGREVTVVVAENASPAKVRLLRRLGVDLVQTGACYDDAEAYARRLARDGAHYISAYNDPHVIAGQSTVGRELDAQLGGSLGGPVTVVCGVGGGGLAAGLGLWAADRPQVRVIGVEAAASTAVSTAVAAGRQVPVDVGPTLADGMAGNIEPGSVTVGLVARHVDRLVTVTEDEIGAALRYLAGERGHVAEGAGAAAVAALLAGKVTPHGRMVAVVSGRNITLRALAAVLAQPRPGAP